MATDFGPHERPDSSRALEVGAAIEKYGLAEEIGARPDAREDPDKETIPQPLRKAS